MNNCYANHHPSFALIHSHLQKFRIIFPKILRGWRPASALPLAWFSDLQTVALVYCKTFRHWKHEKWVMFDMWQYTVSMKYSRFVQCTLERNSSSRWDRRKWWQVSTEIWQNPTSTKHGLRFGSLRYLGCETCRPEISTATWDLQCAVIYSRRFS